MNRLGKLSLAAAAVVLVTCADVGNNNPGVDVSLMVMPNMDGGMMDGSMDGSMDMDGGMDGSMPDMDGGMDGSMPGMDGGMGRILAIPAGPALFGLSGEPGVERIWVYAPDSGTIDAMPFKELLWGGGGMVYGIDGLPVGLTVNPARTMLLMTLKQPGRTIFYDISGKTEHLVLADALIGGLNDDISDPVLSLDNTTVYASNATANRLHKLSAATQTEEQRITSTTVSAMAGARGVAVAADGKVIVGSSALTQTRFLVFEEVAGTLTYNATLSDPLIDGTTLGGRPTDCTRLSGQTPLYCTSSTSTGVGSVLWRWTPGSAPTAIASGTGTFGQIQGSPAGDRVYVVDGTRVRVFYVKNPTAPIAYEDGTFDAAGAIADLAVASDGQAFYVTVTAANKLIRVRTSDLGAAQTVVFQPDGGTKPGPIFFSP